MKTLITVVGLVLILGGFAALGYQGFTYTKQENVAQIGNVKITADTQDTYQLPPVVGGLAIVAGLVLVVVGRKS